jgi:transposase
MLHTRFTKEFRDEAVRLALTSGRSRREVAADLGVGLSTLRHWLDRHREREIDGPSELVDRSSGRQLGPLATLNSAEGYLFSGLTCR